MKASNYNSTFFIIVLFLTQNACTDLFDLEKRPKDEISSADYWQTANDIKLYTNQFYPSAFPVSGSDRYENIFSEETPSDDMVFVEADPRLRGSRSVPANGGFEEYSNIRSVNVLLENYENVEDNFDDYKQYIGEAHFFRAKFYFNLVKEFGAVPLIDQPLDTESEALYKARTPRNEVVDFIIADLDSAIVLLPPGPQEGGTRLNQQIAQLLKSRVALYEGTWEKYHQNDPFGVRDPNPEKYLEQAVEASESIIDSGIYSISSSNNPQWDYFNLFGRVDYSNNSEVLLWKKYNIEQELGHARQFQMGTGQSGGSGLTKSLVESYLCTDGRPISLSAGAKNPLYLGDGSLESVVSNRDPRLTQTVFTPGFPIQISGVDTLMRFERPVVEVAAHTKNTTGYQINKMLNFDPIHHASQTTSAVGFTGWVIMRYAEVLLNYAEAKAELGTLTQNDLDNSINLLRQRVDMPDLNINVGYTDPNWNFPQLSPIINEIRRERRVELVAEGFRWDDIARWAAADELIIGQRLLGAKFNDVDYPDLDAQDFRLTNGYFDELKNQLPNGYEFDPNRDYLSPISTEELTLNSELEQNPGW